MRWCAAYRRSLRAAGRDTPEDRAGMTREAWLGGKRPDVVPVAAPAAHCPPAAVTGQRARESRGPAPGRRRGSRRGAATRAGPDDPADLDPPGINGHPARPEVDTGVER
jgi:hypothetical protein